MEKVCNEYTRVYEAQGVGQLQDPGSNWLIMMQVYVCVYTKSMVVT